MLLFKGPQQLRAIIDTISPRPVPSKRAQKRTAESATVLTSSPFKRMLEAKASRGKRGKGGQTKKNNEKAEARSNDDVECLYCGELFSRSVGEWIRCEGCQKWAHVECSNENDGEFVCEICLSE